ncbi:4Fe-4S binding protein [Candidatus Bathyarchaeota archaeon]|nr:4Fe-4S binding protein [Candidatus Bathyarchaeota archaeon]
MESLRVGVFICECGGNISNFLDVKRVAKEASTWDNVVVSRHYTYMCSTPGIEMIKDSIKRHKLNRVVIACCTPKMHKKKFQMKVEKEGLNQAFLEVANIREQCSWVHPDDWEGATQKAIDITRGAVRKVEKAVPLKSGEMKVNQSVLVIGGGIAGITASLSLAESGFKVYLVEKSPSIGGHMIKYPKVFPTLDCSQCILTPKMGEVADNPNITLYNYSEVKEVSGVPGDFHVKVFLKPRGVDAEKCIACGTCNRVCPVEVIDEFNEGLSKRKAAYIPFPQAVPTVYTIDFDSCTKCGRCVEKCPSGAINLDDKGRMVEIDVGAIILATGFELRGLEDYGEYKYGKHPNVISSLQMERLMDVTGPTKGAIIRPSDGGEVKRIAYVLCAGSRDTDRGVPYCSRVCCLYAIKQALTIRRFIGDIDIWIHYIDIRTPGRRYEEFYKEAQVNGVHFVRGKVAEVIPDGNRLIVRAEDLSINRQIENEVDLVVLCPPIVPTSEISELSEMLKVPLDENKFVLESHPKLDPLATKREGVYACGMASGPKDIQTTVAEAEGAAVKAIEFLHEGKVTIEPNKAFLKEPELCDGCGECVNICPAEAISVEGGKAKINEIVCNGCGVCIPTCPTDALDLQGLTEEQLLAQIKGILAESKAEIKILAFLQSVNPYIAADLAGISRLPYSSDIRTLEVSSTGRLKLKHILYAFAHGADGVMLLEAPTKEGPFGEAHAIAEKRAEDYTWEIEDYGIDSMRLWFSRIYVPDWMKIVKVFETFDRTIKDLGPINLETRRGLLKELEKTSSLGIS